MVCSIDVDSCIIVCEGRIIRLTVSQRNAIVALRERSPLPLSEGEIYRAMWPDRSPAFAIGGAKGCSDAVRSALKRLRARLWLGGNGFYPIRSQSGVGYYWEE